MSQPDPINVEDVLSAIGGFSADEAATVRALVKARQVMAPYPAGQRQRKTRIPRIAFPLAGATAAAVLLAAWWLPSASRGEMTMADVVAAVQKTGSLSFRATNVVVMKITDKNGKTESRRSESSYRQFILASGTIRAETERFITITDLTVGKQLQLQPQTKEAYVQRLNDEPPAPNLYDMLKNLKTDHFERMGDREIDGHKAIGFVVGADDKEFVKGLVFWVDVQTRLPLRADYELKDDQGELVQKSGYEQFLFDGELDPSLFSLTPPAGYRLVDEPIVRYMAGTTPKEEKPKADGPR